MQCDYTFCILVCVHPKSSELGIFNLKHNLFFNRVKPFSSCQVWKYNEGEVTHVGMGHSGDITRVKICPNSKHILSVSADGAILRWKYPF